ncbi:MAG: glycosyltransferase family 4 protein [Acidobacteria bacterium]|nr:glycosyltransferase family 4 protein [Acidobacteriota bacterium]
MRIAFVIQRYGKEVTGGSEAHCRKVINHLKGGYDITVITTCAKDYISWKNEYPEGKDELDSVPIIRFPVVRERNIEEFNRYSDWIFNNPHTRGDELKWLRDQGPYSPDMISYLKKAKNQFDLFFFFTYLYYPCYHGLKEVGEKSILQPTAHDEPAIRLKIYREMFSLPRGIAYNSPWEKKFLVELFPELKEKPSEVIGCGVEFPEGISPARAKRKYNLRLPYLLYGGRIEKGKGIGELISFFSHFLKEEREKLELVLIGKLLMKLPDHPHIRYLGFVPEEDKYALYKGAELVVIPAPLESLSLTLLEAFAQKKAVLVNGHCPVLVEHVLRANGGLYYKNYEEFAESLILLLKDERLRNILGENGFSYAHQNYRWDRVISKYHLLLEKVGNKTN